MEVLQRIMEEINESNSRIQLTEQNITSGTAKNVKCVSCRKILHASIDEKRCKFAEKITFREKKGDYAVAIGYNPALWNECRIDKTNELIAGCLYEMGYAGYYLLNLFPDVTPVKLTKADSCFGNYLETISNALEELQQVSSMELHIFWGSSVYVNADEKKTLDNITRLFKSVYTIGTEEVKHKHPGRGVNSSTIRCNKLKGKTVKLTNSTNGYLR